MVRPDFFWWRWWLEFSSFRLKKFVIAGSSLWWRYLRAEWKTIHSASTTVFSLLALRHREKSSPLYRCAIKLVTIIYHSQHNWYSIDSTISNASSGPILQPFTQNLWLRCLSRTPVNCPSDWDLSKSLRIFFGLTS